MNLLLTSAILAAATAEPLPRRTEPGDDTPPDLAPVRWADVELTGPVRVTGPGDPEIQGSLDGVFLGHLEPERRPNRAQRRAAKRRGR